MRTLLLGLILAIAPATVAWGEGGKLPDVVIEILSNRTRSVDRGEKMQIYSRVWRTPEYFLYDPFSHELEGYRLNPATLDYEPMVSQPNGDLTSQVLGLGLGVRAGQFEDVDFRWLRWLDASGAVLRTPDELARSEFRRAEAAEQRANAERERADAERERADAASDRADRLEAELRQRGRS